MKQLLTLVFVCTICLCGWCVGETDESLSGAMEPVAIKAVMKKVADWQLANPSKHNTADWTYGAFYTGLTAWAQMADTDTYYDALLEFGKKNQWRPDKRVYHADDYVVSQMYIDMYRKYKCPKMIEATQENLDYMLANPSADSIKMPDNGNGNEKRWSWCDALFMGPPVWAMMAQITGESKYLGYMNSEWWTTTELLYDTDEHLYYRDSRYFDRQEANGQKIFWSRGNGWVFAGVVRVLQELPADYPDRGKYVKIYKEMAAKIVDIQPEEGLWHPSLLDPESYPSKEASGSGFYCYGLAWGINNGLLEEKKYLTAVDKAWSGLVSCVHDDGKLGYVQPIGTDPKEVTADQTDVFGVGSFLLAGSEVYKVAVRSGQKVRVVTVSNPTKMFRDSETVSVDGAADKFVFDLRSSKLLRTQVIDGKLLFQVDLWPGQNKKLWLMDRPEGVKVPESDVSTHCRFIPERKDDFGWESDKAAYRMYGPALEYETITCGIDAWCKCVPTPIIDRFIKDYVEKHIPYHNGQADGGDFYKVGNTLGCGGMAPFVDGKVCLSNHNFAEWKVLANGPIRSVFELKYNPWDAGGLGISETKIISIDLGSNLSKIECYYSCADDVSFEAAAGIVTREVSNEIWAEDGVIGYWIVADYPEKGTIGCGVVFDSSYDTKIEQTDNHLLLKTKNVSVRPVVYYAGSCWDKNEEFDSFDKWQRYLKEYKIRIDNPVGVSIGE